MLHKRAIISICAFFYELFNTNYLSDIFQEIEKIDNLICKYWSKKAIYEANDSTFHPSFKLNSATSHYIRILTTLQISLALDHKILPICYYKKLLRLKDTFSYLLQENFPKLLTDFTLALTELEAKTLSKTEFGGMIYNWIYFGNLSSPAKDPLLKLIFIEYYRDFEFIQKTLSEKLPDIIEGVERKCE